MHIIECFSRLPTFPNPIEDWYCLPVAIHYYPKMGLSQSRPEYKSYLTKPNLQSNIDRAETVLCGLIKYHDDMNSIEKVHEVLVQLWNQRGSVGNKHDLPIISAFAGQGQGKTELCRQICINSDRLKVGLSGVEELIVVFTTFHQGSTYSEIEKSSMSIDRSLVWRAMKAFNNTVKINSENMPGTIEDFLKLVRSSFSGKVGIFILLDEILRVPEDQRRELLDLVASIQQDDIGNNIPTFFMVTSLQLAPIAKILKSDFGRDIAAVPLPTLSDKSKEGVIVTLTDLLHRILSIGESPSYVQTLKSTGDVERLIKVMVSVCGDHFRSLENALKALYEILVPLGKHEEAIQMQDLPISVLSRMKTSSQVFPLDYVLSASIIKSIFEVPNMEIMDNNSVHLYNNALKIFLALVVNPTIQVHEPTYAMCISMGVVYIRSREEPISMIVPRVNLPFLFKYPAVDLHTFGFKLLSSGYLSSRSSNCLHDWIPMLIHNIGTALFKSVKDIPDAFEKVMPWIELVRIHALSVGNNLSDLTLHDVLPDAIVAGGEPCTIKINQCVLNEFLVERELNSTDFGVKPSSASSNQPKSDKSTTQMANSKKLIELAAAENCQAAVVSQAEEYHTELIEYVNRYYTVNDQLALGLVSMKLRKANAVNPAELADEIKAQLMTSSGCDSKCFVMIYCCLTNAEIARYADSLPSGTVVVGIETLTNVMKSFGVSCLLEVAESEQVN